MSKFTFPSIKETNDLSSLRLEVRGFISECINNNEFVPAADSWVFAADPEFSRKLGSKGWLGQAIKDLDPDGENVVTAVNFSEYLPRALVAPGVPVTTVGDIDNYGLFTSIGIDI